MKEPIEQFKEKPKERVRQLSVFFLNGGAQIFYVYLDRGEELDEDTKPYEWRIQHVPDVNGGTLEVINTRNIAYYRDRTYLVTKKDVKDAKETPQ